jgi:hypothetical protein
MQRLLHAAHTLVHLFDSFLAPPDLPLPEEGEIQLIRKSLKRLVREANRQEVERLEKELKAAENASGKGGKGKSKTKSSSSSSFDDDLNSRYPITTWTGLPSNEFALPQDVTDMINALLAKPAVDDEKDKKTRRKGKSQGSPPRSKSQAKRGGAGGAGGGAAGSGGNASAEGDDNALAITAAIQGFQLACNRAVISSRASAFNAYLAGFRERSRYIESTILTIESKQQQYQSNWLRMLTLLETPPAEPEVRTFAHSTQ